MQGIRPYDCGQISKYLCGLCWKRIPRDTVHVYKVFWGECCSMEKQHRNLTKAMLQNVKTKQKVILPQEQKGISYMSNETLKIIMWKSNSSLGCFNIFLSTNKKRSLNCCLGLA